MIQIRVFRFNQASRTPFSLTQLGKVCLDIKKDALSDKNGCKAAAKRLGKVFPTEYYSMAMFPKGCFLNVILNKVFWNSHPSGKGNGNCQAICPGHGKYLLINGCDINYVDS